MTIRKFDAFGAVDVAAVFGDGDPIDGFGLDVIAANHNYLAESDQEVFNWLWPTSDDYSDGSGSSLAPFGFRAWPWRQQIQAHVTVEKAPRLNALTVRVRATVTNGLEVALYFETLATGPTPPSWTRLNCVGTGSPAWYTSAEIPFDPGVEESIALYAIGGSDGALMTSAPATYGTPSTFTITRGATVAGSNGSIGESQIIYDSGAWNEDNTTQATMSKAGHYVQWVDGSGNVRISPRRITFVGAADSFHFEPPLTFDEIEKAYGLTIEIRKAPEVEPHNIMGVASAV